MDSTKLKVINSRILNIMDKTSFQNILNKVVNELTSESDSEQISDIEIIPIGDIINELHDFQIELEKTKNNTVLIDI